MSNSIETSNVVPGDVLSYLTENFGNDIECVLRNPRPGDSLIIRADHSHMLENLDQLNNPEVDTPLHGIVKISDTDRNVDTTITAQLAVCLGFSVIKTVGKSVYVFTDEPVAYIHSPLDKINTERLTKLGYNKDNKIEALAHMDMDMLRTLLESQNIEKNEELNRTFVWPDKDQMKNGSKEDLLRLHNILKSNHAKHYTSVLFRKEAIISPVYSKKGEEYTLDLVVYGSVAATGK